MVSCASNAFSRSLSVLRPAAQYGDHSSSLQDLSHFNGPSQLLLDCCYFTRQTANGISLANPLCRPAPVSSLGNGPLTTPARRVLTVPAKHQPIGSGVCNIQPHLEHYPDKTPPGRLHTTNIATRDTLNACTSPRNGTTGSITPSRNCRLDRLLATRPYGDTPGALARPTSDRANFEPATIRRVYRDKRRG